MGTSSSPSVSESASAVATGAISRPSLFGSQLPWADPAWYRAHASPYYGPSHAAFRLKVRAFVDKELTSSNCTAWDEKKALPRAIFKKAFEAGLLPGVVGPPWPTALVGRSFNPYPAGTNGPNAEFDAFHELILVDEICRCGSGGVVWGLVEGLQIGLPPVLLFGSQALRERIAPSCLRGDKVICLCISEPTHGSDVANLKCDAQLSEDGTHYVVNGEKKWITNGMFADYFTVAVRTGKPGSAHKGISFLLIERNMPGVSTRQMLCSGVWASGTAFVTFEDVKVPVDNLIGKQDEAFKYIMYNFNHERWGFVVQANRFARVCLEESAKYAMKRRTFGKRLIEHPVIRWKLAEMARQVEATHAALETLTYQMCTMNKTEQNAKLGGDIALLKVQATKVFEYCAREAAQIFGGASYVRGGQGEKVERLYREVRAYAIPGGSEEILLDFGVRDAVRRYESQSKM